MILLPPKVSTSKRLAIFDFDWTMVKPKAGRRFPKDRSDWEWWNPRVPEVLRDYTRRRFRLVIVTDQSKPWKIDMIRDVMNELQLNITVIIGYEKEFKKPNPSQFRQVFPTPEAFNVPKSFFVGDAAGRLGDWADTDRRFAEAIGVSFYTPEEMFQVPVPVPVAPPDDGAGLDPSWKKGHVVVMVGFPGAGKSTWIRANADADAKTVIRIEGDVYKTAERMVSAARKQHTEHPTHTLVFDATNGTRARRAAYIAFAKEIGFPVVCVWVTTPLASALQRVKEREQKEGIRIPPVALYRYQKSFEAPTDDECRVVIIPTLEYSS